MQLVLRKADTTLTAYTQLQLTSINSSATGYCCIELPSHFFKSIHAPEWEKVECQTNIKVSQSCPALLIQHAERLLDHLAVTAVHFATHYQQEPGILRDQSRRRRVSLGYPTAQYQWYVTLRFGCCVHSYSLTLACIAAGVTKTHKLTYGVGEAKSLNDEPTSINQLGIGAKELQNFLDKLAAKAGGDVTIWCGPKFFMMRSRDDSMDKSEFFLRACICLYAPASHARLSRPRSSLLGNDGQT